MRYKPLLTDSKTEEELLTEKLENELTIVGENDELRLSLEEEYLHNIVMLDLNAEEEKVKNKQTAEDKKLKIAEKAAKAEAKLEQMKAAFANRTAQTLLSSTMSTTEKVFSVVKDAAAGQIEMWGLAAGARALADLGPVAGPPVSASYIGWSQVAAGIVRSLPLGGSASGGGSVSGGGSGGSDSAQQQQEFQPETSSLEVTEQSEGGSVQRFIMVDSEGNDLVQFVTERQNEAARNGA